jgi:uncharacterized protein
VKPETTLAQIEKERGDTPAPHPGGGKVVDRPPPEPGGPRLPRRFYASATIDPNRAGRDVGRIAEEVLQHLTTLPRANVKLTLEIEAHAPEGVPIDLQRVLTENCRTLRFVAHGFEQL